MAHTPRPTFQAPLQAQCIEGEVIVTGPEHMHGAFSAEAARQSAKILGELADAADRPPRAPDDQSSQTRSSDA